MRAFSLFVLITVQLGLAAPAWSVGKKAKSCYSLYLPPPASSLEAEVVNRVFNSDWTTIYKDYLGQTDYQRLLEIQAEGWRFYRKYRHIGDPAWNGNFKPFTIEVTAGEVSFSLDISNASEVKAAIPFSLKRFLVRTLVETAVQNLKYVEFSSLSRLSNGNMELRFGTRNKKGDDGSLTLTLNDLTQGHLLIKEFHSDTPVILFDEDIGLDITSPLYKAVTKDTTFRYPPIVLKRSETTSKKVQLAEDLYNTDIFYENFATSWPTPNIWTPQQQDQVFEKVKSTGRILSASSYRNLVYDIGKDATDQLYKRIRSLVDSIYIPDSKEPLILTSVNIHIAGARDFTEYHRHGFGEIVLSFSERGSLSDIEGLDLPANDGQATALFTDGVLHRPRQSHGRLIIFASLTTRSDYQKKWSRRTLPPLSVYIWPSLANS